MPDELLLNYLSKEELATYRASDAGIYSITVYADKLEEGNCCVSTDTDCCGSELVEQEAIAVATTDHANCC